MRATVINAGEITPALSTRWSEISHANPMLRSPNLRPELFRTVARYYEGVHITILEENGSIVGFFPFCRGKRLYSLASPVPLCDYQAFIVPRDYMVDVRQVLRKSHLPGWAFGSWIAPESSMCQVSPIHLDHSWSVHLHEGWDKYLLQLRRRGRSFGHIGRQMRALERDHGSVAFVAHCPDQSLLRQILGWKATRYGNGTPCPAWIEQVLEALRVGDGSPSLSAVLSALHVDDKVVAAHFGIKSANALYYWFPAFDMKFSRYSPGAILLYLLLQNLSLIGCHTLDFGPGNESYKQEYGNASLPVVSGVIELPTVGNALRKVWRISRAAGRRSKAWLSPAAELPATAQSS